MKEHTFNVLGFIIGATAAIFNKQFGELCRRWQVLISGRDYGLWSFRIPAVVIGILMAALSVVTW